VFLPNLRRRTIASLFLPVIIVGDLKVQKTVTFQRIQTSFLTVFEEKSNVFCQIKAVPGHPWWVQPSLDIAL